MASTHRAVPVTPTSTSGVRPGGSPGIFTRTKGYITVALRVINGYLAQRPNRRATRGAIFGTLDQIAALKWVPKHRPVWRWPEERHHFRSVGPGRRVRHPFSSTIRIPSSRRFGHLRPLSIPSPADEAPIARRSSKAIIELLGLLSSIRVTPKLTRLAAACSRRPECAAPIFPAGRPRPPGHACICSNETTGSVDNRSGSIGSGSTGSTGSIGS
jgi:hypothetical protein